MMVPTLKTVTTGGSEKMGKADTVPKKWVCVGCGKSMAGLTIHRITDTSVDLRRAMELYWKVLDSELEPKDD